ncbi:hypothetical protein DAEQUDRAFT_731866 [Daedalea quercina L-15889]|uniref:Uncharacterized protein n=1 Tax=Daedalea quercina L-15889 TaxID=1314783 RepID=A0A165LYN2_9APHY|nr:hypothetical protein DAEQUDRAFT_731866 [Daedalea quercina L-15889]
MLLKPNSRYPIGHSIVRASIPPGTLLYHGRGDSGYPYMDWLALDPEHSRIFARGENGTLFTFSTTRELKLLYFDGCSANKVGGVTDVQDLLVWGDADHDSDRWDWQSELDRINDTCAWGKPYGVDGYVRMEFDFEIMYCNISDGLQLVSAMPTVNGGGRPPPHGPESPGDDWKSAINFNPPVSPSHYYRATSHGLHTPREVGSHTGLRPLRSPPDPPEGWKGTWPVINNAIRHAGSWHNDFPGDVRVHPDSSSMITFYDPALTSLVVARRSMDRDDYRPGNIASVDMARVRADVAEMMARGFAERSGVDWRGLARVIQERFGDRLPYLRYLLHQPLANVSEQVSAVRKQLIVSLSPYMQRPGVGEPEWFAQTAQNCATRFTAHLPVDKFTKQERVLRNAVDEVLHEICRVLTMAWTEAFGVEAQSLDIAGALMEKWRAEVDTLIEWLDWPVWLKCYPACGVDEFCYIPQRGLPFDPDPDGDVDQTPRCIKIDSLWV